MNEAQYQLMKAIRKLRLFKGFELNDMQNLLPICHYTQYESGQKIYGLGEPSREMLILLMGELNVVGDSGEILAEIPSGSPVGEIGVFTGEPRSATITAAEPSAGFIIARADLQKVLGTCTSRFSRTWSLCSGNAWSKPTTSMTNTSRRSWRCRICWSSIRERPLES